MIPLLIVFHILWKNILFYLLILCYPIIFQVWRLQAALGEQTEITKFSQQEYERLQNVKFSVCVLSSGLKFNCENLYFNHNGSTIN